MTALAVTADVTDLGAMTSAAARVADAFGCLDVVVANAGIAVTGRPILDYEPPEWQQTLDTNLTGVWNTAKAAAPALITNELVPGPTHTEAIGDDEAARQHWQARGEWYKEPEDVARLAVFVAALPPDGPTGQVFSLAGRLL